LNKRVEKLLKTGFTFFSHHLLTARINAYIYTILNRIQEKQWRTT
jgi:hypothetical protein